MERTYEITFDDGTVFTTTTFLEPNDVVLASEAAVVTVEEWVDGELTLVWD
jgi:hypothetical protein